MKLSDLSIHSFIQEYRIKNEVGADIDFNDHLFLFDIYKDFSPKLCVMKAAQVGATTMEIIKVLWAVKNTGLDAIYTLPTDDDVTKMVSSKVNRIIAHNPIFQHWTKDKDSIEQKQVADHFIHFKGTWTQKAAIMVSADWLLFDEIDSCYEPGTEVLTRKGWKKIEDITKKDRLATLNPVDHRVVFQKPTEIIAVSYEDKLYRFTANQLDIGVTKNHKMWARVTGSHNKYKLHAAPSLIDKKFVVHSKGRWLNFKERNGKETIPCWVTKGRKQGSPLLPRKTIYYKAKQVDALAWYEFLGWYLSEGNVQKIKSKGSSRRANGAINIAQKNSKEICIIVDCIRRLGYSPQIYKGKNGVSNIKFSDRHLALYLQSLGYSGDKYLPLRYLYNKREYLEAFLNAYILGDGDDRNVITTKSKKMADCLQIVALQLGKSATIYKNPQGMYKIGILQRNYRRFNKYRASSSTGKIQIENYKGNVHCVTVPNGIILVRGKNRKLPIWCGNSKPDVVEMYASRLQHSKYKWQHFFSHPNASAISKIWEKSDQKHWFIQCATCKERQYMSWPESVDMEHAEFICKYCKHVLTRQERRKGVWVQKYKDREFSGYWVPLLIAPWVSAKEIIDYFHNKSEEYFMTRVLGLPYIGGGNKLTNAHFFQNLTEQNLYPDIDDRVIIGVDTGNSAHYVVGTEKGLFFYGIESDNSYQDIEALLIRWPRSIAIFDQGGDLTAPRALREKYMGRVFLCLYGTDRKTLELIRWGKKDEEGAVVADRNRMIQLVVDEFTYKRIPIQGKENDWYDYWLHWNNLLRKEELDEKTGSVKRKIWVRSGDDHWAHATVYWRIGLSRFSSKGSIVSATNQVKTPTIDTPFVPQQAHDWRR